MDRSADFNRSAFARPLLLSGFTSCLLLFSGCSATPILKALPFANSGTKPSGLYQSNQGVSAEQLPLFFKNIRDDLQSGKSSLAKDKLKQIDKSVLTLIEQSQYDLLNSEILLSFGEANQALAMLQTLAYEQLPTEDQISYLQALAFANSLTGKFLDSAKARARLNQLLGNPEQYHQNQLAIIETLQLLPEQSLQASYESQSDPDFAGWMGLAIVLKLKDKADSRFNQALANWRELYPGHSGNSVLLSGQKPQKTANMSNARPGQSGAIALFLPETGPYSQAGKAVRAGFLAAYNNPRSTYKPSYRFYNSEQSSLQALYKQAVDEGAELIIGPLSKENIQSLADNTLLTVPVLALNHIPNLYKSNLYQFGLSPLDDVSALTNKAWADGRKNALLLMPDNENGARIANYITQDWQRLGGVVLDTQTYDAKNQDFSALIRKLLNINESEYRFNQIASVLPGVKFTPRRRHDVDVIFLSAASEYARQINPQLQTYQAGDVPVYALPNAYTGLLDPGQDGALNRITFCDTPWLLNSAYGGELAMNALRDVWQPFPASYLRLIALGIDVYQLASRIKNHDIQLTAGATGKLSLTSDNRIKRELTCAQFVNGQPVTQTTLPTPAQ